MVCLVSTLGKTIFKKKKKLVCRVFSTRQSLILEKKNLLCLVSALGKTFEVCLVFLPWHSANLWSLPSVLAMTLGKFKTLGKAGFQKCSAHSLCRVFWPVHSANVLFAECNTRQTDLKPSLLFVFFVPSKQTEICTSHIYHQHHIYITNITCISLTTHIYHQHHKHITNVTCHIIYHHNKFTSNPSAPSITTTSANRSTINNHKYHQAGGQRDWFGEGFGEAWATSFDAADWFCTKEKRLHVWHKINIYHTWLKHLYSPRF
jgi:hypothetical protein